jgi:hypothetical protein
MCGLLGVASTEGMKNRSKRLDFIRMGLDIDSWRGWESTGLALVTEGSKVPPIVYKRALNGRDFIQLNQVEKYLHDIEKYSVAIGHNRAATTGRGNIIDHNAHPFQYGRITLAHNGHIRNTYELKGASTGAECQVDSAQVAFSMNANGEQETLEQCEGGFVFVWWNSENNTLNIARNQDRPMHFVFADKENTLYWASELTQLLHLLKDVDIDEDKGMLFPEPFNWYQFNLKNLREYKKIPFVKRQGRHSTTNRRTSLIGHTGAEAEYAGMGWTEEEMVAWEMETETLYDTSRTTKAHITGNEEISNLEEIEEIRQVVANERLKDVKLSGIPTSKKRINRAKTELKKMGIDYNSLRNCEPIRWVKYKNQNNLGSVIAKAKKDGRLVEVLQVRFEQWLDYQKCNNLLIDCVNVRNGPNNDIRIIGTVSARMAPFLERWKRRNDGQNSEDPKAESLDRIYDGPDGIKITLARFRELVAGGCASCDEQIEPKEHGTLLWVARPPRPICSNCSQDPGVLELLGISEDKLQLMMH